MNKCMTGTGNCEWGTPQELFAQLDKTYGPFTLDVCASAENAKCVRFYDQAENGLEQDWGKNRCWMNPPYGRTIGQWMQKAYQSSIHGATVVCLVPARTDTAWWHCWAVLGEIRFLRGRVTFVGDKKHPAPFPSAIVVFRPNVGWA